MSNTNLDQSRKATCAVALMAALALALMAVLAFPCAAFAHDATALRALSLFTQADDGEAPNPTETPGAAGGISENPTSTPELTTAEQLANLSLKASAKPRKSAWAKARQDGVAGLEQTAVVGLKASLAGQGTASGSIRYRLYSAKRGWTDVARDGSAALTRNKPASAARIWLSGAASKYYDVYYRAYLADYGWLDWACNKQVAGTTTLPSQLEMFQIKLVKKGEAAPGRTDAFRLKNRWSALEYAYRDDTKVKQLLEVKHLGGVRAKVVLRTKSASGWSTALSCNGYVGRAGTGEAREWLARTPQGDFEITSAFGIKGNPGAKLPYVKVTSALYWCADRAYYNRLVNIFEHPHDCTGEHLIDYAPHYNYGLFFDYNTDPVRYGAGSAFFVHCTGPGSTGGTGGCIAVSEANMKSIIRMVGYNARLLIYPK